MELELDGDKQFRSEAVNKMKVFVLPDPGQPKHTGLDWIQDVWDGHALMDTYGW